MKSIHLLAALFLSVGCATKAPVERHPASTGDTKTVTAGSNVDVAINLRQFTITEVVTTEIVSHGPAKIALEIDGAVGSSLDSAYTRKRPGQPKYKNLILKRVMGEKSDWREWYESAQAGRFDRRSGSIIILDQDGETEIIFKDAIPVKWMPPEVNKLSDGLEGMEVEVEIIELK